MLLRSTLTSAAQLLIARLLWPAAGAEKIGCCGASRRYPVVVRPLLHGTANVLLVCT